MPGHFVLWSLCHFHWLSDCLAWGKRGDMLSTPLTEEGWAGVSLGAGRGGMGQEREAPTASIHHIKGLPHFRTYWTVENGCEVSTLVGKPFYWFLGKAGRNQFCQQEDLRRTCNTGVAYIIVLSLSVVPGNILFQRQRIHTCIMYWPEFRFLTFSSHAELMNCSALHHSDDGWSMLGWNDSLPVVKQVKDFPWYW